MIGLVFALALTGPGAPPPPLLSRPGVPGAELRVNARLDIPDEIAPAVVPYMQCLLASAGVPSYARGRPLPPPPGIGHV